MRRRKSVNIIISVVLTVIMAIGFIPVVNTQAIDHNLITYHKDNPDGMLIKSGAYKPPGTAVVEEVDNLFSAEFDEAVQSNGEKTIIFSTSSDGILTEAEVLEQIAAAKVEPNDMFNAKFNASVKAIGDYAFYGQSSLTDVDISSNVTSIGDSAFYECTSLTNVIIPDSVIDIDEWAFGYCTILTSVTIGKSVASIGYGAFRNCIELIEINVITSNTSYLSLDGVLFDQNKTLLIYPAGKTGEYSIPDGIMSIGVFAFYECTGLTYIDIPDSVKKIGDSAFYCTSLTSVVIGNGVKSIGDSAFEDCTDLKHIEIPDSVRSIGDEVFDGCTNLKEINVSQGNINYSSTQGVLFDKDKTTLIVFPAGKTGEYIIPDSVKNIGNSAFYNCFDLMSIDIPNSVKSISDWAFGYCVSLTSVIIPDSVKSIGDFTFNNCSNLSEVYFDGDEPCMGESTFEGVSEGAVAYVYPFAEGFPEEGELWNGLIVRYRKPLFLTAYQYLPFSYMLPTNDGSGWRKKPGIPWPDWLEISAEDTSIRKRGEIYGAPKAGDYGEVNVTVQAIDENDNPLDYEMTFTIDIKERLNQTRLGEMNFYSMENPMGLEIYNDKEDIFIVNVYDTNPDDLEIMFDYNKADFIGLWINGVLQENSYSKPALDDPKFDSTIITVYGQTLAGLDSNTEHVLAVEFKTGGLASGEQYVVAQNFRINVVPRDTNTNTNNTYRRTMPIIVSVLNISDEPIPLAAVLSEPKTEPLSEDPIKPVALNFFDVKRTDWFYNDVLWAYQKQIMVGISSTEFAPHMPSSPAMIAMTLARMLNIDLNKYNGVSGAWYAKAMVWADSVRVFDGIDGLTPEMKIDRGKLMVIIGKFLRIAGVYTTTTDEYIAFSDAGKMTADERNAFQALYKLGIVYGKSGGMMDPRGISTRVELAAVLHRVATHLN